MKTFCRNLILNFKFLEKSRPQNLLCVFTKEIKQQMRENAKTCEIQAKSLVFSLFLREIGISKLIFDKKFLSN